jgi:hypothetical protein
LSDFGLAEIALTFPAREKKFLNPGDETSDQGFCVTGEAEIATGYLALPKFGTA